MDKNIIIAIGMLSENLQRISNGESIAYSKESFDNLVSEDSCLAKMTKIWDGSNGWLTEFREKFPSLYSSCDGREGYDMDVSGDVEVFIEQQLLKFKK